MDLNGDSAAGPARSRGKRTAAGTHGGADRRGYPTGDGDRTGVGR